MVSTENTQTLPSGLLLGRKIEQSKQKCIVYTAKTKQRGLWLGCQLGR